MFFIPGVLISALTFPGVIIHEWAHKFFCERLGVKVHAVKYFQLKNPAGYVTHEQPQNYNQTFWISVGPLIVNSATAIILSFIATQVISGSFFWGFLYWIAISAGMHSFPSDHDMQHISSASKEGVQMLLLLHVHMVLNYYSLMNDSILLIMLLIRLHLTLRQMDT